MTLQRWISPLLCCVLVLVVGRQASAQVVDYTEVRDWPKPGHVGSRHSRGVELRSGIGSGN